MKVDGFPGVEVSIRMNGDVLTEHIDDEVEQELDTATCYVAVTSGSPFRIEIEAPKTTRLEGDSIYFKTTIDGHITRHNGWIHKAALRDSQRPTVTVMVNSHYSIEGKQRFEFGDVTIREC